MSTDAAVENSATVFSSRAQGMGKNTVTISFFKNYREYSQYTENLESECGNIVGEQDSMLVDLKGPILNPFSLKYIAENDKTRLLQGET